MKKQQFMILVFSVATLSIVVVAYGLSVERNTYHFREKHVHYRPSLQAGSFIEGIPPEAKTVLILPSCVSCVASKSDWSALIREHDHFDTIILTNGKKEDVYAVAKYRVEQSAIFTIDQVVIDNERYGTFDLYPVGIATVQEGSVRAWESR